MARSTNHLLLEGLDHPLQSALLRDAWLQLPVRLSHHWHAHARCSHHQRHRRHDFYLRLRAGHSIHTSLMKHFSRVPQQLSQHLFHRVQAHRILYSIALAGHVIDTHIVQQQPEIPTISDPYVMHGSMRRFTGGSARCLGLVWGHLMTARSCPLLSKTTVRLRKGYGCKFC